MNEDHSPVKPRRRGRAPAAPQADAALQGRVTERTRALLSEGARRLRLAPPEVQIRFDLRGRAAGQARFGAGLPAVLRYNPVLLAANAEDFLATTVPHEVAHLLAYCRHGARIRPHGREWRALMELFGVAPERCHSYDLSVLPGRVLRQFDYHCACRGHQLTSIRHRRVLAGQVYLCRDCATPLRPGRHPDGG